jgi:hypothetical protein
MWRDAAEVWLDGLRRVEALSDVPMMSDKEAYIRATGHETRINDVLKTVAHVHELPQEVVQNLLDQALFQTDAEAPEAPEAERNDIDPEQTGPIAESDPTAPGARSIETPVNTQVQQKRGGKRKFSRDKLAEAKKMKAAGQRNNQIAKVPYGPSPTEAQRRSVPPILKYHFGSKTNLEE